MEEAEEKIFFNFSLFRRKVFAATLHNINYRTKELNSHTRSAQMLMRVNMKNISLWYFRSFFHNFSRV